MQFSPLNHNQHLPQRADEVIDCAESNCFGSGLNDEGWED
jgi:hypothetical protein